jgi:arsenate reductase
MKNRDLRVCAQRRPFADGSGLLRILADREIVRAASAGTQPGDHIHRVVIEAMREVDIDLLGHKPQLLTPELAAGAELLVRMGCGESCPVGPGLCREDWSLADLKDAPLDHVRKLRDEIRARVAAHIALEGWARS